MLKLKKDRRFIDFEYEFEDGETKNYKYFEITTKQMKDAFNISDDDRKAQIDYTIDVLTHSIEGEDVEKMIKEQEESNIFDFRDTLEGALGKQKKRK